MRHLFLTIAVVLAMVTLVSVTLAQSGPLEIPWYTIDGGGGTTSMGEGFALSGTIGQPDAGISSGAIYTLRGGFWGLATALGTLVRPVYLPLIQK
ncbi:MAG TPA: hypothetical protein VLY63_12380 [Anaerolineae bacterium]|nr:hypothetical protein [Anaerolineae bacterium]